MGWGGGASPIEPRQPGSFQRTLGGVLVGLAVQALDVAHAAEEAEHLWFVRVDSVWLRAASVLGLAPKWVYLGCWGSAFACSSRM